MLYQIVNPMAISYLVQPVLRVYTVIVIEFQRRSGRLSLFPSRESIEFRPVFGYDRSVIQKQGEQKNTGSLMKISGLRAGRRIRG